MTENLLHPDWQRLWRLERAHAELEAQAGQPSWQPAVRTISRLRRYARRQVDRQRRRAVRVAPEERRGVLRSLISALYASHLYESAWVELEAAALCQVASTNVFGRGGRDRRDVSEAKHWLANLPEMLREHRDLTGSLNVSERTSLMLAGWTRLRLSLTGNQGTRLRAALAGDAGHTSPDLALRERLPAAVLAAFAEWERHETTTGSKSLWSRIIRELERDLSHENVEYFGGEPPAIEEFVAREDAREDALDDLLIRAGLSRGESDWLALFRQGMTDPEIARTLGIAVGTAGSYRARVKTKLERAAAVARAAE